MKTLLRTALTMAVVAGAAMTGGCYPAVKIYRDVLQRELDNGPADVARLEAQRKAADSETDAASRDLRVAQDEKRSAQADLTRLEQRQAAVSAESERLAARCRQLDANIAAARAGGAAAGPASARGVPQEVQAASVRLARLEDWLRQQQALLAGDPNSPQNRSRGQQLRGQAYLIAVAQVLQCVDLPACRRAIEQDPALERAAQPAAQAVASWHMAYEGIFAWTDNDSPLATLQGVSSRFSQAQTYARDTARKLSESNTPAARAMAEQYVALAEVLKLAEPVVVAKETGTTIALPSRSVHLGAMMRLWKAGVACDEQPRPQAAAMLKAIALVDVACGPRWDARAYLAGRIQAVSEQRSALAVLLVEPPTSSPGAKTPG
jgi:hypothetical protein